MQSVEYDNLHQIWDQSHENKSPVFQLRSSVLLDKLPQNGEGLTALDAGCGTGFYSKALLERRFKVDAFDLSNYAINLLSSKLSPEELDRFYPEVADVFTYKAGHQPYNVIILSEVLEHIQDDKAALNTIAGYLSRDGHLIISVPTGPELYSIDDELSGHVRRYTMKELTRLLDDCGLQIVDKKKYGFPAIYLYMLCKRFFFKKENYNKLIKDNSTISFKSKIYRLISATLVFIDRMFLWTNKGIGVVIVAARK